MYYITVLHNIETSLVSQFEERRHRRTFSNCTSTIAGCTGIIDIEAQWALNRTFRYGIVLATAYQHRQKCQKEKNILLHSRLHFY